MNRRWDEHQRGTAKSKFTRAFAPLEIALLLATAESKELALQLEAQIKKLSKEEKEKIIRNPQSFLSKNPQFTLQNLQDF